MTYFLECKENTDCTGSTDKCAADNICKCGTANPCTGTTPVCDSNACSGCKKTDGSAGDGSTKGDCPRQTDKCQSDGSCKGKIRNKGERGNFWSLS